jgi:hypothetical protein
MHVPMLGSYRVWPIRIINFGFNYLKQNQNQLWFWELQLALKPNPILESKPEPRHGSRIGTKNVGKWYFFGKSGLGLGVHRQFTVGSKPSYPELGLIPRIGIETRLTSKIF